MNIITPSTQMKSNTKRSSSLETECLFGERVEILDEYLNLVYCRLITDNYCGWIKKNSIGKLKKLTHRVINKRTLIYTHPDPKSNIISYAPMGGILANEHIEADWAETHLIIKNKLKVGYVPTKHIVDIDHKAKDWVAIAEQLEGTPYRWGGRNTIGLDCSALLQLSYQTYGEILPRNTSQQIFLKKKVIDNISDLNRGCVVFWEGHVGIMIDNVNCIHANAFHMKTITEPLIEIINRMGKNFEILKMMDFN